MTRIEASVVINKPVKDVFTYLSNYDRLPAWAGAVMASEVTSLGPIHAGSTYWLLGKFLGKQLDSIYQVTEYVPARMLTAKRTSGPLPSLFHWTFEPIASGTKLTQQIEIEAGDFFKLAEPLVLRSTHRQIAFDLENLKDLLEAGVMTS